MKTILVLGICILLIMPIISARKIKENPEPIPEPECLYHFWYINSEDKCKEVCSSHELMLPSFPIYGTKKECKEELKEGK